MNSALRTFLFATIGIALSPCIEFEREAIRYHHDAYADEMRMTLNYEGIFGGDRSQERPDASPLNRKKLNDQQVEQFESGKTIRNSFGMGSK